MASARVAAPALESESNLSGKVYGVAGRGIFQELQVTVNLPDKREMSTTRSRGAGLRLQYPIDILAAHAHQVRYTHRPDPRFVQPQHLRRRERQSPRRPLPVGALGAEEAIKGVPGDGKRAEDGDGRVAGVEECEDGRAILYAHWTHSHYQQWLGWLVPR